MWTLVNLLIIMPQTTQSIPPEDVMLDIQRYMRPFQQELHFALGLIEDPKFREHVVDYERDILHEITRQIFDYMNPDFNTFVSSLNLHYNTLRGYQYFEKREDVKAVIMAALKEYSLGIWMTVYQSGLFGLEGYDFFLNHVKGDLLLLKIHSQTF